MTSRNQSSSVFERCIDCFVRPFNKLTNRYSQSLDEDGGMFVMLFWVCALLGLGFGLIGGPIVGVAELARNEIESGEFVSAVIAHWLHWLHGGGWFALGVPITVEVFHLYRKKWVAALAFGMFALINPVLIKGLAGVNRSIKSEWTRILDDEERAAREFYESDPDPADYEEWRRP